MKKILCCLLISVTCPSFAQFLHRDGQNIVDGNGQNVVLRGLGLGGWMVQEGYMLQTESFAGPQHVIKQKITDLIGATNTAEFYQAWRNNGITKRDIDSLKAWGFNSVRLPMHYNLYTLPIENEAGSENTWLDEGFTITDNLLQWCADNQMYLILDMHATPGGQGKDAAISDYDPTKPSLWESQANRTKMIALWRRLADRYKDNPWIGAYDIINEPNWNFTGTNQNGCDENSNAPLRALMVSVTNAIREVDNHHMIIAEGNCWGNNYNGILPLWDANMALSFHKYWNYNDIGSIQGMLNLRAQYNVPIWMGEGGENSNVWFRDAISLLESNNIGWAFWPMKKIENIAGVTSVTKTADYDVLLNYWKNGGTQPTVNFAKTALMQIAENFKMQNVTVKPDVIDAMFRQVQTLDTKKYKSNVVPGKIFATHYDLGTNGKAYWDKVIADYHVATSGANTAWNSGYTMRNDGVDIEKCTDSPTNGYQVGFIEANEWLQYTIPSAALTAYDVDIRYSGTGKLYLEDAIGQISEAIVLPPTGSITTWNTVTLTDVLLKAGDNKVKAYFENAGFNLNFIEFKNPRTSSQVALKIIDASTNMLGDKVGVTFNKELQSSINFSLSNLVLKVNGTTVAISSIGYNIPEQSAIVIKPATAINVTDVVTLDYAGTNIVASDATSQSTFTDMPVQNRVGNILGISGKIEAENFYNNVGLNTETTTDSGLGQNIAYTDSGDYLDYLVNISEAGNYKIEYRTAGQSATGKIKLQLINDTTADIQTVTLPATGGWQTWQTVASEAVLPAGRYILRLTIVDPGFNLNWVKFTYIMPDADNDNVGDAADLCPDTPSGDLVDFSGCTVFSLAANNFTVQTTGETCRTSNNGIITINAASANSYVAAISGNSVNQTIPFTNSTSFGSLQAGTYNVCITIP
ncbi:MAG TPA: cellulase family glycosylhydrolase, partial [Flavobacterium sp.]|nr:cellulase family glycosylhydrolase [Flavobacterium sp.]